MKRMFIPLLAITYVSCGDHIESETSESMVDSIQNQYTNADQHDIQRIDTNKVSADGLKQSFWYFIGLDMPDRGYGDYDTIESGFYHNGQKVGKWTYFAKDGSIDSIVNY